jgi:hypothetical protein
MNRTGDTRKYYISAMITKKKAGPAYIYQTKQILALSTQQTKRQHDTPFQNEILRLAISETKDFADVTNNTFRQD